MADVANAIENCLADGDELVPPAEELESYYILLGNQEIPELQWQFPGRRTHSPDGANKTESNSNVENSETQEPAKNDFDFSDEVAPTQMRVRTQNSTPKSAKKKMANFAGVMEVLKKKNAEGSN